MSTPEITNIESFPLPPDAPEDLITGWIKVLNRQLDNIDKEMALVRNTLESLKAQREWEMRENS